MPIVIRDYLDGGLLGRTAHQAGSLRGAREREKWSTDIALRQQSQAAQMRQQERMARLQHEQGLERIREQSEAAQSNQMESIALRAIINESQKGKERAWRGDQDAKDKAWRGDQDAKDKAWRGDQDAKDKAWREDQDAKDKAWREEQNEREIEAAKERDKAARAHRLMELQERDRLEQEAEQREIARKAAHIESLTKRQRKDLERGARAYEKSVEDINKLAKTRNLPEHQRLKMIEENAKDPRWKIHDSVVSSPLHAVAMEQTEKWPTVLIGDEEVPLVKDKNGDFNEAETRAQYEERNTKKAQVLQKEKEAIRRVAVEKRDTRIRVLKDQMDVYRDLARETDAEGRFRHPNAVNKIEQLQGRIDDLLEIGETRFSNDPEINSIAEEAVLAYRKDRDKSRVVELEKRADAGDEAAKEALAVLFSRFIKVR